MWKSSSFDPNFLMHLFADNNAHIARKRPLKLICVNVNGIWGSLEELKHMMLKVRPGIVCFSETVPMSDAPRILPGFNWLSVPATRAPNERGLLITVKKGMGLRAELVAVHPSSPIMRVLFTNTSGSVVFCVAGAVYVPYIGPAVGVSSDASGKG